MTELFGPGRLARRTLLRLALPVAGGVLVLAGPLRARAEDGPKATTDNKVSIDNFAFTPAAIAVSKGSTVTWTNRDDIPHQVVCPTAKARSKVLDTDQSFALRFDQPGRFDYFCALHPHMTGTVTVGA